MDITKKIVLIVGGSGFVGSKLTEALLLRGYAVIVMDLVPIRFAHPDLTFLKMNIAVETPEVTLFEGVFGIINLAGVTIGKRWNKLYQKLIYSSRIDTTRTIVRMIQNSKNPPSVLISASAVGYYGDRKDELLTEDAPPGNDFLSKLCVDWEAEAIRAESLGVRVVRIRTAHILGPGGLLKTLEPLFRKGLGGYFGNGSQYMPWVHIRDVIAIYIFALEQDLSGVFNIGAGQTLSQKELFIQFAKAVRSPLPFVFRIPHVVARVVLGDFADSLITGQNTDSSKIVRAGYQYEFETLDKGLSDLYSQNM